MRFNLSLVGAGRIAAAHAGAIEASGGAVGCVTVVDPVQHAREALADRLGAKPYASIQDLLADADTSSQIQGLVVCTPPSARVGVVEQAIGAGWAVLLEKPIAHQSEDARKIVRLSESAKGAGVAVGACHRFTPAVQTMIEQVHAGRIGRWLRFENVFAASIPGIESHWMSDPQVSGGGSLLDTGFHSLDLFQYLAGPCELAGAVLSRAWPGRGDSNATVLLSSDGRGGVLALPGDAAGPGHDVAGQIATGWAEPSRFEVRLIGSEGMLAYDFDDGDAVVWTSSAGATERLAVAPHDERFTRQLLAFAESAQQGRLDPRLCAPAEALGIMHLVERAQGVPSPVSTPGAGPAQAPRAVGNPAVAAPVSA
ncbi:MAG: Gfo/Idh/MocA family oxidoreductase [Planctomycetota bacterium]